MRAVHVGDSHLIAPDIDYTLSQAPFPGAFENLSQAEAVILYQEVVSSLAHGWQRTLHWMQTHGPFDLAVHMGDVTCSCDRRGLQHPSMIRMARGVRQRLEGVAGQARFVWGNHDLATSFSEQGIDPEVFACCRDTFGEPFWAIEIEGVLCLGVCSPLATYRGHHPGLASWRRSQKEFVGDTLRVHSGQPWLLYSHEFFALRNLRREMVDHLPSLERVLCGDLHNATAGSVLRSLGKLSPLPERAGLFGFQTALARKYSLVPSTAPLWCTGYGLHTLETDKGKVTREKSIDLSFESTHPNLRTAQFFRCLMWVWEFNLKKFLY